MSDDRTSNLEVARARLRNPEGESWVTLREAEAAALDEEIARLQRLLTDEPPTLITPEKLFAMANWIETGGDWCRTVIDLRQMANLLRDAQPKSTQSNTSGDAGNQAGWDRGGGASDSSPGETRPAELSVEPTPVPALKEKVEQLRDLRVRLKSGEYSGTDIMQAWIVLGEYADALERTASEPSAAPSGNEASDVRDLEVRGLRAELAARSAVSPSATPSQSTTIPDKVFDGYSIWTELQNDPQARQRTSHENVQDVLNAILRFKRAVLPPSAAQVEHVNTLPKITEDVVDLLWGSHLIESDSPGEKWEWSQEAVDFVCLLNQRMNERRASQAPTACRFITPSSFYCAKGDVHALAGDGTCGVRPSETKSAQCPCWHSWRTDCQGLRDGTCRAAQQGAPAETSAAQGASCGDLSGLPRHGMAIEGAAVMRQTVQGGSRQGCTALESLLPETQPTSPATDADVNPSARLCHCGHSWGSHNLTDECRVCSCDRYIAESERESQ